MFRRIAQIACCLIAAALLFLAGCGDSEAAQDFQAELFDGGEFRLSEHYGENAVVINFWYPSCAPCREEMPEFQKAWEELQGEPVRFVGMFVPLGFDTESLAREFVAELGLTFEFATDKQQAIAAAYGVELFPATWFIDKGGEVAYTYTGALDKERIASEVRKLINE